MNPSLLTVANVTNQVKHIKPFVASNPETEEMMQMKPIRMRMGLSLVHAPDRSVCAAMIKMDAAFIVFPCCF